MALAAAALQAVWAAAARAAARVAVTAAAAAPRLAPADGVPATTLATAAAHRTVSVILANQAAGVGWVAAAAAATSLTGASNARVHAALFAAAGAVRNCSSTPGGGACSSGSTNSNSNSSSSTNTSSRSTSSRDGSSSRSSGGGGNSSSRSSRSRSSSSSSSSDSTKRHNVTGTTTSGAGRIDSPLLIALIMRANSPDKLLALVQQHNSYLDHKHVSAVSTRLKQLCQQQRGLVKQPAVQQLLQHMEQLLATEAFVARCGARELANIIHASAYICRLPAFDLLLPAFVAKRAEAKPQELANTVWAVATMGQQVAPEQLQQLLTALVSKLPEANTQEVANTIWAVATMGQQMPTQQLHQLLETLVSKVDEAKPQELANTLLAVAKLGQQASPEQLKQLLNAFVSKVDEAKPQELANTVWAVATMGQQVPPQQLQQLLAALVSKLPEAVTQNIANTVWAVATMGQQISKQQLQQLLAALVSKLPEAVPQAIANTVWAVATMGQQVSQQQLEQLLTALVSKLPEANPQAIANTMLAVAKMGQQISKQQLQQLLAALVSKLPEADPQAIANTVWACAKLRYTPSHLLAVLDSQQHAVEQLLQAMNPQALANTAYACALLGYSSTSMPAVLLQRAVQLLQCPDKQHSFTTQHLSNLAWSAAVLDLQQKLPAVLKLAQACRGQRGSMAAEELRQLYQVHLWLLDCQLPTAGPEGLSGCLTAQQLQDCRHSWEQELEQKASADTASQTQRQVFKAIRQLLPDSTWQQRPVMEQRTADGAYSIDIAAVTSAGVRLAIEVDGPTHFLLEPVRAVDGPTACRNRALAARRYRVDSIPFFEWDKLETHEQQQKYLASKLGVAAAAG